MKLRRNRFYDHNERRIAGASTLAIVAYDRITNLKETPRAKSKSASIMGLTDFVSVTI